MAPPSLLEHAIDMPSTTSLLIKRVLPDSTLISIIIPLVILVVFLVATSSYFIRRLWTKRLVVRTESEEAPTSPPLAERRPSNWTRQNSNVLWSMYLNDDDLRAHFSKPSKDSRLFSIGSVSTVGPLDMPAARPSVVVEHDENPAEPNMATKAVKTVQQAQTVVHTMPRRATYANVQTERGEGESWLGGFHRRKLSLTTS